jgi:hypothetical protein
LQCARLRRQIALPRPLVLPGLVEPARRGFARRLRPPKATVPPGARNLARGGPFLPHLRLPPPPCLPQQIAALAFRSRFCGAVVGGRAGNRAGGGPRSRGNRCQLLYRRRTCAAVCAMGCTQVQPCAAVFTRVHPCAAVCSRVHPCALVCTRVHPCAAVCSRVHPCAAVCRRTVRRLVGDRPPSTFRHVDIVCGG